MIDRSIKCVNMRKHTIFVSLPCVCHMTKKSCEFRSKSGHVEKLVLDDTAAARLYNFVRRSCGNHMKPVGFFPQNCYHTTDVW